MFYIIDRGSSVPKGAAGDVFLRIDMWNDYNFVTLFEAFVYDEAGKLHELGGVKIGFKGQSESMATYNKIPKQFGGLNDDFFSLGMSVEYYAKINSVGDGLKRILLSSLRDVVFDENIIKEIEYEKVFSVSLLRGVSITTVKGQYRRVMLGGAPLTDFEFLYASASREGLASVQLSFDVKADSKPSTNIHAIIGRNGSGKTTILNGMIDAVAGSGEGRGKFLCQDFDEYIQISRDYFSRLVSVSFSAFDIFNPPQEQRIPSLGTCYYYIGLKKIGEGGALKSQSELYDEFRIAMSECVASSGKRGRWLQAVEMLGSDENFAEIDLKSLINKTGDDLHRASLKTISAMSSGHAIVLLTITKLVETVEEKTLVVIDEPESHLHPPLLSAFLRALSDLLQDRNGVAIVATHSPVVLQEIPSSCVWRIVRHGVVVRHTRPGVETFGENVGTLTRDVFGLEVVKSGFHKLLSADVERGDTYDEILAQYNGQLGFEAKAILQAMLVSRNTEE